MKQFDTVEKALDELKKGHLILVTDDEDRENEGDLICAASFATTENVNFMATHAKGLICMPMSAEICRKLQFPQMVMDNTDNHETAFTVSIDHKTTTTGISAEERGITARACVDPDTKPEDFRRPGHMFPLMAKKNGTLERNGHTEATVDLMRLDNSVPNAATCRSLELGVIRCVDEITEQVRRNTGLSVTDIQIERVLNGQSCSMDPAAKEIIVRQGRLYTEKILSAIMEAGFDLKAIPSVIMGGGASILKRHVTPQDGLCRQIYLTDVHANASGYERIVGQMCAK